MASLAYEFLPNEYRMDSDAREFYENGIDCYRKHNLLIQNIIFLTLTWVSFLRFWLCF